MTKSEEWEQFSAYRPMIEDAKRRERERIIVMLTNNMNWLAEAERNGQVDVVPGVERYRRIIERIQKLS